MHLLDYNTHTIFSLSRASLFAAEGAIGLLVQNIEANAYGARERARNRKIAQFARFFDLTTAKTNTNL